MTKTVLVTNLNEINGLKIVCKKCGANWFLPFASKDIPRKCISCDNEMPMNTIVSLMDKLQEINTIGEKQGFNILIEIEQK